MKILLAGASVAIGRSLVRQLKLAGHGVVGIVRSSEGGESIASLGAEPVIADALDAVAVREALERARPEVVINQLTSLPKRYSPESMKSAAERNARVRVEGNENLLEAARAIGVRRYLAQSSAFWYEPGIGLADEQMSFAFDATAGIARGTRDYAQLESSVRRTAGIEGIVLRYGFFYGPGTWYSKDGDMGEQVRQGLVPVIGQGEGIWSFVHVEDAAAATVAALDGVSGVYNVVDDDPVAQNRWLPSFAAWAGAPAPPHVTSEQALAAAGADAVYSATRLRGASNAKAKRELGFSPRRLAWLVE